MAAAEFSSIAVINTAARQLRWKGRGPLWRTALTIGILAWPFWVVLGALWFVRINAEAVRKETGKGALRQIGEMLRLGFGQIIGPNEYYIFELYRDANRRRAGEYLLRRWTKRGITRHTRPVEPTPMKDKLLFALRCEEHGLPVVPVLMAFRRGRMVYSRDREARLPPQDLFVKPNPGSGGMGGERWDYIGEGRYLGSKKDLTLSEAELIEHLRRKSRIWPRLVQPRVTNHPSIADLSNGALTTIRLVTCRNERGAFEPTNASFRMARGKNRTVDNLHAGGVGSVVDIASGRLGLASNRGQFATTGWLDRHPDTGAEILGRQLPFWEEIVALGVRAHTSAFSDRTVVGWDIGILADGPCLVEGNSNPDFDIIQRTLRAPVGEARIGRLLALAVIQRTDIGKGVAERLTRRSPAPVRFGEQGSSSGSLLRS